MTRHIQRYRLFRKEGFTRLAALRGVYDLFKGRTVQLPSTNKISIFILNARRAFCLEHKNYPTILRMNIESHDQLMREVRVVDRFAGMEIKIDHCAFYPIVE